MVWMVNSLQSRLSSRSQFQLQFGFEPRVKQLLSADKASLHLWWRVVDSAPFSENLKKDTGEPYKVATDNLCVTMGHYGKITENTYL